MHVVIVCVCVYDNSVENLNGLSLGHWYHAVCYGREGKKKKKKYKVETDELLTEAYTKSGREIEGWERLYFLECLGKPFQGNRIA